MYESIYPLFEKHRSQTLTIHPAYALLSTLFLRHLSSRKRARASRQDSSLCTLNLLPPRIRLEIEIFQKGIFA